MDDDEEYYEYDVEDDIDPEEYLEELDTEDPPDISRMKSQSSMIFLQTETIKQNLDRKIEDLCDLMGTKYDETLILLRHFKWFIDHLQNSDWFSNKEKLSIEAGLAPKAKPMNIIEDGKFTCPICFASEDEIEFDSLSCGHKVCIGCWKALINEEVNSKEVQFFWKCPGQFEDGKPCNVIVPYSFNEKYLKPGNSIKYIKKLCVSYVQENKAIRWCPAPDCPFAVENPSLITRSIKCKCGTVFCFKCGEEDHQPCDCEMRAAWENKNTTESKNIKWVDLYTKNCPKCKKPIEKNQGCNHMKCGHSGCAHEFCWICLQPWDTHKGGFYKCNAFESGKEDHKKDNNKDSDKKELEKYVFYYERFSNNGKGLNSAMLLCEKLQKSAHDLQTRFKVPFSETNFLGDASDALCKARRILKWTYAYAFYIKNQKKKELFEFHQKDLESFCEELHELLEFKFSSAIKSQGGTLNLKVFQNYKSEVVSSYNKCQKFSTDLLRAVDISMDALSSPRVN